MSSLDLELELAKKRVQELENIQTKANSVDMNKLSNFYDMLKSDTIVDKLIDTLQIQCKDRNIVRTAIKLHLDSRKAELAKKSDSDFEKILAESDNTLSFSKDSKVPITKNNNFSNFKHRRKDNNESISFSKSPRLISKSDLGERNRYFTDPMVYNILVKLDEIDIIALADLYKGEGDFVTDFNHFTLFDVLDECTYLGIDADGVEFSDTLRTLVPICIKFGDTYYTADGSNDRGKKYNKMSGISDCYNIIRLNKKRCLSILLDILKTNFVDINISKSVRLAWNNYKDDDRTLFYYFEECDKKGCQIINDSYLGTKKNFSDISLADVYNFIKWLAFKAYLMMTNNDVAEAERLCSEFLKQIEFFTPFDFVSQGGMNTDNLFGNKSMKVTKLTEIYERNKSRIVKI